MTRTRRVQLEPGDYKYWNCELFQIGLAELESRTVEQLSPIDLKMVSLLADGAGPADIAPILGRGRSTIKNHLRLLYKTIGQNDPRFQPRVKLATYWGCELFQIGLKELGLIA